MPSTRAAQVEWAKTFVAVVKPKVALYGLTEDAMTLFETAYTKLQTVWDKSRNRTTRTPVTLEELQNALTEMKRQAGLLVSIIQGTASVTSDMKVAAGLTVRKTTRKPPEKVKTAPFIKQLKIDGRIGTFQLQQDKSRRGRAAGAKSATVLFSRPAADGSPTGVWEFAVNSTRTTVEVVFPSSAIGDAYYVTAFWTNSRDESGPAAKPLWVSLPAGGVVATDAKSAMKLKAA
jgi:hypothetical protein